ncbi:APC family permease [Clostridium sp. YIM B02515]|uniref:APC family permease n=1 Tax=Clostridium rhizosphaerae TaxID=2803861 RepID=A0ABS1TF83_9CLOT|nr:APC family permease [Clostridium rhizosphaerae]MBL4938038.1 APC family permease [Clostridium rhizosphaerae]
MFSKLRRLLIGETLTTDQLSHEKFNVLWGLPILSSDAISSVAYAGEEILWVLIPVLGMMSYKYMFYAALCIVFLLFLLVFSYRQTIDNYPHGGGSYIVSKDNLGTIPSLTAAASLSIDYILTVAVSTSAGTAAITSAIPELLPYKVLITVLIIVLLSIGNLRGIKDSSRMFGVPTYLFILTVGIMIVTGILRYYFFGYRPSPIVPIEAKQTMGNITVLLFLRAFASGCTALTGVEAVSDGIPNFKAPAQKHAKIVLGLLAGTVLFIFGGLSYLSTLYHAAPDPNVTVLAQIGTQVFGSGFMFYALQFTTALILIMAANTAFADFPLLLSFIARDGYAPRQFSRRGKRLGFSNGIMLLCIASSLLAIIFSGSTHLLMPLYAVGVFISFTLSQSGMFTKWIKEKTPGWRHKAVINGMGALVTFCTVIVIGATKFLHGAWIVCILIPILVVIMLRIRRHYLRVAEQLKLTADLRPKEVIPNDDKQHVVILVDSLNKSFIKSLNYAKHLSSNIVAFHVATDSECAEKLQKKWEEYNVGIPLIVKHSPYRDVYEPLVKFIESEEHASKPGEIVTVVISQFVITKWWHNILHNQTSLFIKSMLYKRRNIVVVTVPYIIQE